jgi:hypothetical protein
MHPLRNLKIVEVFSWWSTFTRIVGNLCNVASTVDTSTVEEKSKLTANDSMKAGMAKRLQIIASDDNSTLAAESKEKISNIIANIEGELSEEKG